MILIQTSSVAGVNERSSSWVSFCKIGAGLPTSEFLRLRNSNTKPYSSGALALRPDPSVIMALPQPRGDVHSRTSIVVA